MRHDWPPRHDRPPRPLEAPRATRRHAPGCAAARPALPEPGARLAGAAGPAGPAHPDLAAAARHHGRRAGHRRDTRRGGVRPGPGRPAHGGALPRRRLLRGLGAHAPVVGRAPERPDRLPGRPARVPPGARASPSGRAGGRPGDPGRAVRRGRAGLGRGVGRLGRRRPGPGPGPVPARRGPGPAGRLHPAVALARSGPRPPGRPRPGAPGRGAHPGLAGGLRLRLRGPGGLGRPVGLAVVRRARRAAPAADPGRDRRVARPGCRPAGRQRLGCRDGRELHQVAAHVARLRPAARPARRGRQRAGRGRLVPRQGAAGRLIALGAAGRPRRPRTAACTSWPFPLSRPGKHEPRDSLGS